MQFQIADRLQWEQHQLRDQITRLEARVAALESGGKFPPHPSMGESPIHPSAPNSGAQPSVPNFGTHPVEIELDITSGMGLTAGPLRKA
jgi:hypothetical protein